MHCRWMPLMLLSAAATDGFSASASLRAFFVCSHSISVLLLSPSSVARACECCSQRRAKERAGKRMQRTVEQRESGRD